MSTGDTFNNSGSQIGAQGQMSTASNFSQEMTSNAVDVDLAALATELHEAHLLSEELDSGRDFMSIIGQVVEAETAASAGGQGEIKGKIVASLKKAGQEGPGSLF